MCQKSKSKKSRRLRKQTAAAAAAEPAEEACLLEQSLPAADAAAPDLGKIEQAWQVCRQAESMLACAKWGTALRWLAKGLQLAQLAEPSAGVIQLRSRLHAHRAGPLPLAAVDKSQVSLLCGAGAEQRERVCAADLG